MTWGYVLALDLGRCTPHLIRDKQRIALFSRALVKAIDMKAYGEPLIQHFGEGNKAGYTLVQLIETSNICAHFCEQDNAAFLDIFSCKKFDVDVAEAVTREYFGPRDIIRHYYARTIPAELK